MRAELCVPAVKVGGVRRGGRVWGKLGPRGATVLQKDRHGAQTGRSCPVESAV